MPSRRGRASDRADTRRLLLEAAAVVFAERGFEAATLEEITERAGFTRGAFYSNFTSKDELFLALMEHENAKSAAAISEAVTRGDPLLDIALADPLPPDERRRRNLVWLEFMLYAARRPELAAKLRAAPTRASALASIIEAAEAEGRFELPIAATDIADLMMAINTQTGLAAALGEKRVQRARMYAALFRLLGWSDVDVGESPGPSRRRSARRGHAG